MADTMMLAQGEVFAAPTGRSRRRLILFVLAAVGCVGLVAGALWATGLLRVLSVGNAEAASGISYDLPSAVESDLLASTRGEIGAQAFQGQEAQKINASLPFTTAPLEAANPFSLASAGANDKDRALLCLTQAVYYEAGFEPVEGRRAVAQVILNRLRHPAFPKSVCGVVYDGSARPGCQFSFTCDGSLRRAPSPAAWTAARRVAEEALNGHVATSVGAATHYHANYVAPYWAPKLAKLAQIGAHIFYRWPGAWGRKGAFSGRYTGSEFIPSMLSTAGAVSVLEVPAEQAGVLPQARDEYRAPNDVGGRLDVTKGWTLNIPSPGESNSALSTALSTQGGAAAAPAAARDVVALNDAAKDTVQ